MSSAESASSCELARALEDAASAADVAELLKRHPYDALNQAWASLPAVQRGALALCRNFSGTIIHELTPR